MPVILTSHFNGVILKGPFLGCQFHSMGRITVPAALPASATVTGFAVNIGSAGNIEVLGIFEWTLCSDWSTVKVRHLGGGQDPQP